MGNTEAELVLLAKALLSSVLLVTFECFLDEREATTTDSLNLFVEAICSYRGSYRH